MSRLCYGNYKGLVTRLAACRNRDFTEKAEAEIIAILEDAGWDDALATVESLCGMPSLPPNVYGALQSALSERRARLDVRERRTEVVEENKPADPRWAAKYDEVAKEILRYHRCDMARWSNQDGRLVLLVEPVPADGCPYGWHSVIYHFCVTKCERERKYVVERGRDGRSIGPVKEVITYDPEPHDEQYAKIAADDIKGQLRYMDIYQQSLAWYRAQRGTTSVDVAPSISSNTMRSIGEVLASAI